MPNDDKTAPAVSDESVPPPPPGFHPVQADYSGITLDMSKSRPLYTPPAGVTLDLSKSRPLPVTDEIPPPPPGFKPIAAAQPGAFQTRKGGPIQNVNTPAAPPTRENQVEDIQTALRQEADLTPGAGLVIGAAKGLYQTGIGLNKLIAKGERAVGIPLTQEQEELIGRDTKLSDLVTGENTAGSLSPFSEAMSKGTTLGEKTGEVGEEIAEWMAGDAALEGVAKLSKIAKNAPHLIELMEKFPNAAKMIIGLGEKAAPIAKAATIGGTQSAVKEGDIDAAKSGAIGGAIGGAVSEVAAPWLRSLAKAVGLGTSAEEDLVRAAQPGKRNVRFLGDWRTAQPRIAQEVEAGGDFKDLKDAAERIGEVRSKIWTDEVMPAIERHADEVFDTTKVAKAVRDKITPVLQKNFPEDAKFLQEFADKYTSGSPLFSGEATVGEVEQEIELYNNKLADEGYWKKTPKERAVMEKANPKIAAWRTASDEMRNSLYEHLDKAGEKGVRELKNLYGAVGNIENEIMGQTNVAARQRPISLKQMVGMAAGIAHGGPGGWIAAALPIIDKLYNAPDELLNRAVAKSAPAGPVKQAVQAGFRAGTPVAKAGTGVAGENVVRFIASDGSTHEVNADQLDKARAIDPGLKVLQ